MSRAYLVLLLIFRQYEKGTWLKSRRERAVELDSYVKSANQCKGSASHDNSQSETRSVRKPTSLFHGSRLESQRTKTSFSCRSYLSRWILQAKVHPSSTGKLSQDGIFSRIPDTLEHKHTHASAMIVKEIYGIFSRYLGTRREGFLFLPDSYQTLKVTRRGFLTDI